MRPRRLVVRGFGAAGLALAMLISSVAMCTAASAVPTSQPLMPLSTLLMVCGPRELLSITECPA